MKPGIYEGVPFDEYQQWDAINNSTLKVLNTKSALHCKYYMDNGAPDTDAMSLGRALHTRILEPDTFDERYFVTPKIVRSGKKWHALIEHAGDKEIIWTEDVEMLEAVVNCLRCKNVAGLFEGVKLETCIAWTDPVTGLLCKARMDIWNDFFNYAGDLKSTCDASPNAFAKKIKDLMYHQQAAFYSDGLAALTGKSPDFYLFPVEKKPPYDSAAYELTQDTLLAGRMEYQRALKTIKKCLETNVWPGYCHYGTEELSLSDWDLKSAGVHQYNLEAEL